MSKKITMLRKRIRPILYGLIVTMGLIGAIINQQTGGYFPDDPTTYLLNHPWPGMLVLMTFYAYTGIILLRGRREKLQFKIDSQMPSQLAFGLLAGAIFITGVVLVLSALGVYTFQGVAINDGILLGLALGIGAGILEEVVFRGLLLPHFDKKFGYVKAIVIVSLIFGAFHSLNTVGSPDEQIIGPVSTAIAGAMLCSAYYVYRRVWFAMGVHIAWNFTLFGIYGLFTSGISSDKSGLFLHSIHGDQFLTGGSFGPEASVVAIALEFVFIALFLYIAKRRGNLA